MISFYNIDNLITCSTSTKKILFYNTRNNIKNRHNIARLAMTINFYLNIFYVKY